MAIPIKTTTPKATGTLTFFGTGQLISDLDYYVELAHRTNAMRLHKVSSTKTYH